MANPENPTLSVAENPHPSPTPENSAPENSLQKPSENESETRERIKPKAGFVEKARAAAARVLSEAGFTFKKGRGRPKYCPVCKNKFPAKSACENCGGTGVVPGKSDSAIDSVPSLAVPDGRPDDSPMREAVGGVAESVVDSGADNSVPALFRRAVCRSVKGVLGTLKRVVGAMANRAGCRPEFVKKLLADVEPEPEAVNDFTDSLDAVLKKHNVQPKNAEEWALVINGVRLVAPFGVAITELRSEIVRQREERKHSMEAIRESLRREVMEEIQRIQFADAAKRNQPGAGGN